jgi:alkylhydroperoxidase/carboxymuconolactone decarboxylase family protein YurZ
LQDVVQRYPDVWDAYNRLGEAIAKAGLPDATTERLAKLAIAVGNGQEGAVHSRTRRGLAAGHSAEQLRHVEILSITTIGWPSAMAALSWIDDIIEEADKS